LKEILCKSDILNKKEENNKESDFKNDENVNYKQV